MEMDMEMEKERKGKGKGKGRERLYIHVVFSSPNTWCNNNYVILMIVSIL